MWDSKLVEVARELDFRDMMRLIELTKVHEKTIYFFFNHCVFDQILNQFC